MSIFSERWPTTSLLLLATLVSTAHAPGAAHAQVPRSGEIRQLVSFTFLPGASAEALEVYERRVLPLYRRDEAMLSLRAFREVESPTPVDLVVVRAFDGMAGMDESNDALRAMSAEGTSIGALYGEIAAASSGHTDQLVEMLPSLGSGDPSASRLTAFVSYRVVPGATVTWEREMRAAVELEASLGVPSSTGRFLLADGWSHLRMLGFDSLGQYERYRRALRASGILQRIDSATALRRDMILAAVGELSIR